MAGCSRGYRFATRYVAEQGRLVMARSIVISDEAEAMIVWAQEVLRGFNGRRHSRRDALDWLLRDACEYGSPTVGAQARKTWPWSDEVKAWNMKHAE